MATESGTPVASIVRLNAADLVQLENLLQENQLPTEDCVAQCNAFVGIFDDSRLIAAGGLEAAGEYALLRSIVVSPEFRSSGLAAALTDFLIAEARTRGIQALFLLTETAEQYFSRFGFEPIARDQAPKAIAATGQFAGICPQSAIFMRRPLDA